MISMRFDPALLKAIDALAERIGTTNRTELLEEGARIILERHRRPGRPKGKSR